MPHSSVFICLFLWQGLELTLPPKYWNYRCVLPSTQPHYRSSSEHCVFVRLWAFVCIALSAKCLSLTLATLVLIFLISAEIRTSRWDLFTGDAYSLVSIPLYPQAFSTYSPALTSHNSRNPCPCWQKCCSVYHQSPRFLFHSSAVLGMEAGSLGMLGEHSTTEFHPNPRILLNNCF